MTRAKALSLLFAAALVLRLSAAFVLGVGGPPVEDERGYVALAHSLAEGRGFELPIADRVDVVDRPVAPRTSFRAPLLPLVLAPFAAASGSVPLLRVVCLVIGALGAPLLWLAVRAELPARLSLCVALAYAAWPPSVYLSLRVLSEPLGQALLLASVVVLVVARDRDGARGLPAWAGALAGLAVLARPAALPVAALLVLANRGWRRGLVFAAALLLVLTPWIARNAALHGRALITTNSGVTLVGGNCGAALEAAQPGKWVAPDVAYAGRADAPDLSLWGWSELTEEASDRRFRDDALRFVRRNPGAAVRLSAWKLVRLFDPDPHSSKGDALWKRLLGWLTTAPVLALALIGLAAARVGAPRVTPPWPLLILGTVLVAAVFYGDTRMRTAADPALLVLAGHGLLALDVLRRQRGEAFPEARTTEK